MDYKDYWNRNIEDWGKFYLDISHGHEDLDAPKWLGSIYNKSIAKYEARLMRERFSRTLKFLDENIDPGVVFGDIGCGTGVFVIEALKRKADVIAMDFSKRALEVTKHNVERFFPNANVRYEHIDISREGLPNTDLAIMVGVTPYIQNIDLALNNVLASTNILFAHYVDPNHWANKLRKTISALNVRRLICHNQDTVDKIYFANGFVLHDRNKFATGYIDVVENLKN